MREECKHNAVSRMVWQHWIKTGLPISRHELSAAFAKLDHEEPFKAFFVDGELPDCEKIVFYAQRSTLVRLKGWLPSREAMRRQLLRISFAVTLTGPDFDDFD